MIVGKIKRESGKRKFIEVLSMKVFKGKNAVWFILIFIIYNVLPMISIDGNINITNKWVLIITFIFYYCGDLIFIPVIVRNKIVLYDDYFVFYYGFSTEKFYIKDIKEIKRSHNIIASSANSIDRIYISTKHKDLYVSLQKNEEFIQQIKEKLFC